MGLILKARAILGLDRADIELGTLTLIAGKNAQGKTSLLRSLVSCLCKTIPVEIDKKYCSLIVKNGNETGEAELSSENWMVSVKFPEAAKSISGSPIEISKMAAGIESFVDSKDKDRARDFVELLKAYPTKDELFNKLKLVGYEKLTDDLWKTIEIHGWDQALDNTARKGATMKGEWQNISGESKYGEKKAETWTHPDIMVAMPPEYSRFSGKNSEIESLKEFLSFCTATLDAAQKDAGATEQQVADLKKQADRVPFLNESIPVIEKSLEGLFKNAHDIEKALRELPDGEQPKSMLCPHCNKPVQVENGMLVEVKLLSDEEIMKRQKAIVECKIDLDKIKDEINKQTVQFHAEKAELKTAQEAAQKLSKIDHRKKKDVDKDSAIKQLNEWIDCAKKRINAIEKTAQAKTVHEKILANLQIVEIMKPEGLRKESLVKTLAVFNQCLAELCKLAKWPRLIEVTGDMEIVMTDSVFRTPYALCSHGEQYCIRVALQVAAAAFDKSKIVLIDDSDGILSNWRSGLFNALLQLKIQAVVVLATMKKEKLPDMKKVGGRVYWVEAGIAEEV